MQKELTREQREALQRFKASAGSDWKCELIAVWVCRRGEPLADGQALRATRSTLGLDGLARVQI